MRPVDLRVRIAAFWVSCLSSALVLLVLLGLIADAFGQALPPLQLPSVEDTGPKATEVTLTFPEGYVMQLGTAVTFSSEFVDGLVRTQSLDYLERVVESKKPKPPVGMKIGTIVGTSFSPSSPTGVYVTGWVIEKACRVDITIDGAAPVQVVPTATLPGYPKTWRYDIPLRWADGKPHKIYARAIACVTNGLIGPLDNATALSRWSFVCPP
jgi:hypothetical protein